MRKGMSTVLPSMVKYVCMPCIICQSCASVCAEVALYCDYHRSSWTSLSPAGHTPTMKAGQELCSGPGRGSYPTQEQSRGSIRPIEQDEGQASEFKSLREVKCDIQSQQPGRNAGLE